MEDGACFEGDENIGKNEEWNISES